ncbi:MAG: carboxypeptidase regulatory-like domain-containing protein, partial [Prevotella sp.]|nr:carboxypeptidase regulatory-like domain-containing protein [Prevotella sp.]
MRIWLFTLALLLSAVTSTAQTISRRYDGVSMSQALADIDKSTEQYKVNFIYDELDDFPVNCHFNQINVLDAIMAVIGHYPVKVTIQGQYVFVECVEKRQTKVRGRVLGARSAPLPNANITIYDARTGEKVCSGVSNEGGE